MNCRHQKDHAGIENVWDAVSDPAKGRQPAEGLKGKIAVQEVVLDPVLRVDKCLSTGDYPNAVSPISSKKRLQW
jgi:hypothetical protein